jgi:NarL family two-component system sensor histidine kinase LiaS
MGESIVFCLLLAAVVLYFLYVYDYISFTGRWLDIVMNVATIVLVVFSLGALFGYWQSGKVKRRLEVLSESMLMLEKGNLSRPIPDLGEDEIGRLGEQLGRISKRWEEQVTSLQRLSANNAELAERVRFSAITEERQRLARELHDAVSQQLFAISMTATALARTMEKDFAKAQRQVELIEEMASVAQSEMRALLLHLRPVHLEGKRLAQGMHELVQELRAKVPIDIQLVMDEDIQLPRGIEDHLFRIVQEALSNTLRHSRADKLEIRLQRRNDYVRLYIRDNGVGFDLDVKKAASYGILSMQERVNEIGGSINIISAPGMGTRIDIRVPILIEEGSDSDEQSDEQ